VSVPGYQSIDEIPLDEDEDEEEAPPAPPAPPAPKPASSRRQHVSRPIERMSLSDIIGDTGRALTGDEQALSRIGGGAERGTLDTDMARGLRRGVEDLAIGSSEGTTGRYRGDSAGSVGALQALTFDHGDEITSAVQGRPIDEVRREMEQAEEQAPVAAGAGRLAGGLAQAAILPGAGPTAGMGGRLAVAGAQGAGFGALTAHGRSEGETPGERLAEMPGGALAGGATGLALGGVFEGAGGALRAARRVGEGADRARVASVATGTSRELGDTLMREAESLPGGIPALASRLRRLGLTTHGFELPGAGGAAETQRRALEAVDRLGSEGELGRIYDQLDETVRVPRERLTDSLLSTAQRIESDPNSGRAADRILSRAQDWEGRLPPEMPYREAMRAQRGLADDATWIDPTSGSPRPQVLAGRSAASGVRATLDDLAEPALGPDELARFQGTRRDYQAAEFARDWSDRALARMARNQPIGLQDVTAMTGGQTRMEQLGRLLASRGMRSRGGAASATLRELAQRVGRRGDAPVRAADPLTQRLGRLLAGGAGGATAEPRGPSIDEIPIDEIPIDEGDE
jgi:hypothetical protein